jgi:plasmid stabilization system protein ParE
MRFVRFKDEAVADVTEAAKWYDQQQAGLGQSFLDDIEATLVRIDRRPNAHRQIAGGFRRALAGRFPYAIYVIVTVDAIVVYGVFHQRRSPNVVKKRLETGP